MKIQKWNHEDCELSENEINVLNQFEPVHFDLALLQLVMSDLAQTSDWSWNDETNKLTYGNAAVHIPPSSELQSALVVGYFKRLFIEHLTRG